MMTEETANPSPDKLVEDKILKAFEAEGICDTEALKALGRKISSGTLKAVDWSMIFENMTERQAETELEQKVEN